MCPRRILILDSHRDSSHQLSFLLQLGGHQITLVHTPAEAVNWVGLIEEFGHPFDLLLVNRYSGDFPLARMMAEIRKVTVDLPILLVERVENRNSECLPMDGNSHSCRPVNLLTAVNELVGRFTEPEEQRD